MLRFAVMLLALSFVDSALAQPAPSQAVPKARPVSKKPAAPAGAATPMPGGPCIGVISLLGDRFSVASMGFSGRRITGIRFNNWGLDDLVVERVRAAAGSRIAVRRIAASKDAFKGYAPGIALFADRNAKAAAMVQQAAGQAHCERYIVVTPATVRTIHRYIISGFGIVNAGRPIRSITRLWAVVLANVHDGRTFEFLNGEVLGQDGNLLKESTNFREVDDSFWPEPMEAADTPKMRQAVRSQLTEILDKDLPGVLAGK